MPLVSEPPLWVAQVYTTGSQQQLRIRPTLVLLIRGHLGAGSYKGFPADSNEQSGKPPVWRLKRRQQVGSQMEGMGWPEEGGAAGSCLCRGASCLSWPSRFSLLCPPYHSIPFLNGCINKKKVEQTKNQVFSDPSENWGHRATVALRIGKLGTCRGSPDQEHEATVGARPVGTVQL